MAKILVPLKRVPDYEMKVKLDEQGRGIRTEAVKKWIINPFDEIAVEEALRIKEAREDVEEIVAVCIGPEAASEQLLSALAMGADRAVLVLTDAEVDSDAAHRILVAIYAKDEYKLVLMGKQAIDSDANQTGQLLAAHLQQPQATFASKIVIDESWGFAEVTREVDGGLQTIKISLPAVVTTDLRLNEPRYASLKGIVQAKKKSMEKIPLPDLGIEFSPKVRVLNMALPIERQAGVKVESVEELVDKLKNEAKVI